MIAPTIQTLFEDKKVRHEGPVLTRDQSLDDALSPLMFSGPHASATGIKTWLDPAADENNTHVWDFATANWRTLNSSHSTKPSVVYHAIPRRENLIAVLKTIRETYLKQYPEVVRVLSREGGANLCWTEFSDQQLREVAQAGRETIWRWATKAAELNHVSLDRKPIDDFADAASRLADAEVHLDEVERILIALRQAGILTASQRGMLQAQYLR